MPLRVSCPGPVLRLACLGGGRRGPVSPLPGLGLCAPRGGGLRVWGVPAPGDGVGGGGGGRPLRRALRLCGRGGRWGGGSPCLGPSLCLPWAGNKVSITGLRSGHGGRGPNTAPVPACLPSPGAVRVALWRVGAGLLVLRGSCGSRWLGRGGGPCSGLPRVRRSPAGGRGDHPLCLRGVGAGVPAACGPMGEVGGTGGGGVAPWPPCSFSGGAACGSLPSPSFVAGALPSGVRVQSGSRGSPVRWVWPAAGGLALWGGRGRGGPQTAPPEAPTDPACPFALPERVTLRASLAMLWSWGARPPYCSDSSLRAAPGRGPCVVLARLCGLARRS